MGKFDGVLLASDFDNTLIYTEAAMRQGAEMPTLSEKNREALEYFTAEGGRFAIATGRALPSFIRFSERIPMNAPGIVCNGAVLHDFSSGETLETALLDGAVRGRGQKVLDRFPTLAVEAYHVDNVIHGVRPNHITRKHEHLTKVTVTESPSLLDVPLPLGKLLFEEERPVLLEVQKYIARQPWASEYEWILSAETLLEMTARGANKGAMLRRLARRLEISMEHVYCAGDEANDISMLTVAKEGFAPANCAAAVRACGATIVADARKDAIAEIVGILDRKYK